MLRIVTPSLERFSYVPVAQFLQSVSPLYLVSLGGDLYGDRSLDGSLSASSRDESVNQDRQHDGGGSDLGDAFNAPGRDPSEPLTQLAS
jgi:hypothetical protein